VQLQVRVINNAMAGGLRKVQWISRNDYSVLERHMSRAADSLHVLRKVQLLQNTKLKKSLLLRTWKQQKEALQPLPILLAAPNLILGADLRWFVRWVSEQPGEASVVLATGEAVLLTSTSGIFTLPVSGKFIAFRLYQAAAYQGQYSFTLPKVDADSIRVALWGDSQGGWRAFAQVAEQVKKVGVDLSIGAGDLVADGAEAKSYVSFLQVLSGMQSPQLLVPGNHDYDGNYDSLQPKALRAYLMRDSETTYGFHRIGPLAVMTLDPNAYFPVSLPAASAQREALEGVLASSDWQEASWRMVVLHQPPYSQGWPGYHGEYSIREVLEPYFHQGWIDLVVAGHTHDYERLQREFSGHAVHFFVVGGGGGGLEPEGIKSDYPVMDQLIKKHHVGILQLDKNQMRWSVLDLEGQVLDSLSLVKKQQ
jgi:predicted phosphodiesterase